MAREKTLMLVNVIFQSSFFFPSNPAANVLMNSLLDDTYGVYYESRNTQWIANMLFEEVVGEHFRFRETVFSCQDHAGAAWEHTFKWTLGFPHSVGVKDKMIGRDKWSFF